MSNLFWWEVVEGEDVGPVEATTIESGGPAQLAGLLPGDVVTEMLSIPHYMTPDEVQDLGILGGMIQLGVNIERNRAFGLFTIGLRVQRGAVTFDTALDIGLSNPCACPWDCANGDGQVGIEEFLPSSDPGARSASPATSMEAGWGSPTS